MREELIRQSDVLDLHQAASKQNNLGLNLIDAYSPLPEIFSQDVLQSIKEQGTGAEAFLLMLTKRLNHLLDLTKARTQMDKNVSVLGQGVDLARNLYQTRMTMAEDSYASCYYAGLLPTTVNTAAAVRVLVEDRLKEYVDIVEIDQCAGSWIDFPKDQQSSLGTEGKFNQLGHNLVLGDRQWIFEQKVIIRLFVKENLVCRKWQEIEKKVQSIKYLVSDFLEAGVEQEIKAVIDHRLCEQAQIISLSSVSRLGSNSWLGNLNETTEVVL